MDFSVHKLAAGDFEITVYVPPTRAGEPNLGAMNAVCNAVAGIRPSAFDASPPKAEPVPHDLAAAMLRDGVVPHPTIEPLHHAVDAPMPPFDPLKDDDEGIEAEPARYPPGVSCNVTGECE